VRDAGKAAKENKLSRTEKQEPLKLRKPHNGDSGNEVVREFNGASAKKESRPEGAALSSHSPWPGVGQAVCRRHRAATHRKVKLIRLKSCGSADTSAGFNEHLSYSDAGFPE
jgi:hypothetical protein